VPPSRDSPPAESPESRLGGRTVADLSDAELLSIFPGSEIEHLPVEDGEAP
jgi:hypothetical protein